jgi:hypothetical protein
MGGEVLVDTDNKALHMFGRGPRREAKWDVVVYNQLMIAGTVFGIHGIKYARHLEVMNNTSWKRGSDMYEDKRDSINWFVNQYHKDSVMTPRELEEKMVELSYFYNQEDCKYKKP